MNNYLDMDDDNPYRPHGAVNPDRSGHRPLVNSHFIALPENGEPPTAESAEDAAKAFTAAPDTERPAVAAHAAELAEKKEDRDEAKAEKDEKTVESFIE